MPKQLLHTSLALELASYLNRQPSTMAVVRECLHHADVMSLDLAGRLTEYEVKTTRSDLLHELWSALNVFERGGSCGPKTRKHQLYLSAAENHSQAPNTFYFLLGASIPQWGRYEIDELPKGFPYGFAELGANSIAIIRPAIPLHNSAADLDTITQMLRVSSRAALRHELRGAQE